MDRRTVRSERSKATLKAAFLELFQTKEPEEITVVELCQKAGLNRSTFYAHYEYMHNLVQEVLWESVKKVLEGHTSTQWDLPLEEDGGVDRDYIISYMHRFLNDPTIQRFCRCKNSGNYRALVIRAHVVLTLGSSQDPVRYYAAYCHNACVLNFLLEWFNDGSPIPEETAAGIIHDFSRIMYKREP